MNFDDIKDELLSVTDTGLKYATSLDSTSEFEVFEGLGVKLLLEDESDWRRGVICNSTADSVDIELGETKETYQFSTIRKAKLDNL